MFGVNLASKRVQGIIVALFTWVLEVVQLAKGGITMDEFQIIAASFAAIWTVAGKLHADAKNSG
jgi:hypothetical protein